MVVTGDIAFLAAETRRIAGGAGRQKIQFRVNRACAFPCEPEFSVQYLFPVRMIFQEIFSQKWIGAVRPAVINGALPGIQAVFHVDGVSGTAFRAFSATVAEGAGKRYELEHVEAVAPGKPLPDIIMDFAEAARICGLASVSCRGNAVAPKFGPFIRFVFIVERCAPR
mgnify:CR=1 FL=1